MAEGLVEGIVPSSDFAEDQSRRGSNLGGRFGPKELQKFFRRGVGHAFFNPAKPQALAPNRLRVHGVPKKNGNNFSSSALSGRRPYSQISNASACFTPSAFSLPYHSASLSRWRWAM